MDYRFWVGLAVVALVAGTVLLIRRRRPRSSRDDGLTKQFMQFARRRSSKIHSSMSRPDAPVVATSFNELCSQFILETGDSPFTDDKSGREREASYIQWRREQPVIV